MKLVQDITNLSGKRALVRVDFNVPVSAGKVIDDFRIKESLPTIELLRKKGASVILISHFEGGGKTLAVVAEYLKKYFPVSFIPNYSSPDFSKNLQEGEVVLCENLRQNLGEKENSEEFVKNLAALGDIFVNEAFSVSHREHSSVVGVPKLLPSYAGLRFQSEYENLSDAFHPVQPFLFALGGAKFDTKFSLIEKFVSLADFVFVGGALANNFFLKKGYSIGKSLHSEGNFNIDNLLSNRKIVLPLDVVVQDGESVSVKKPEEVTNGDIIVDCGKETVEMLKQYLKQSKTVLWNGPFGAYEKGFKKSTNLFAEAIAQSSARSIVGGGDTIASVSSLGIFDKFSFVSTAGGAMLDFLSKGTLPGIDALN
ncbi:MAG: phosphoglycerate kinase [Candidatus Pacebacteria bacterium]|nr:phosphoglycerate kinase [Candidatus Paceibacterota bacterium]